MFLTFDISCVVSVLLLVFLEGILSLDNAVVLALTVKNLPAEQQRKALNYGIWSAFALRALALMFVTTLIKMMWLKAVASVYLIWLGASHFIKPETKEAQARIIPRSFWMTIAVVEMLDFVFSIDSIFAAVAVNTSFYTILIGGILGIIMMRFAANIFIKLVEKYRWLESAAYVLVIGIGLKLGIHCVIGG